MQEPIINIFRTLEEALYFKNSQINTQFIFSGVQLLPNRSNKYIQVTNTPNGINLEDWAVKVFSVCSGLELGDITDSFMVESLTNSVNGNPQFIWSLTNIPIDFGWGLIYLEITQAVGETFYTQPFRISDIDKEKTCEISYRQSNSDEMQVIGFQLWFNDVDLMQDITPYYEVSTQSWVNAILEQGEVEYWRTELMPKYLLVKLKAILGLPYVYINSIRANLKEPFEIPQKTSQENFGEISTTLVFHNNDIYIQSGGTNGDFLNTDFDSNDFLIYN